MCFNGVLEKDSSDDEIDMFSSDHLAERQSMEFPQIKDLTFKNGEDDFKINKSCVFGMVFVLV